MKFLKNKVLISVLLTLMFSVAVSGGCGGGGGGHYSGNFGDSSENTTPEDVTTELVSSDVEQPTPEEPALSDQFGEENADDDEYGAGKINTFMLLNRTTWSVDQIAVYNSKDVSCQILAGNKVDRNANRYDASKISFVISNGNTMAWATPDAKTTPIADDLMLLFNHSNINSIDVTWYFAPMLRPAKEFSEPWRNNLYQASVTGNAQVGNGIETIMVLEDFNNNELFAKKILIRNEFTALNGEPYRCEVTLSRVDNFSLIDQTDWQVKSIGIFGEGKTPELDYTIDFAQYVSKYIDYKITLLTSVDNNVRVLNLKDNKGNTVTDLPLQFMDNSLHTGYIYASILRAARGFENNGKQQNGTEIFEAKFPSKNLPPEIRSQEKYFEREVMYISDYGPYGTITINNSFYILIPTDQTYHHYWVQVVLEPYNPNKKF